MAILKDLKLSDLVAKNQDVTNALEQAKTYTDAVSSSLSVDQKDADTLAAAKAYTDEKIIELSVSLMGEITWRYNCVESRLDSIEGRLPEESRIDSIVAQNAQGGFTASVDSALNSLNAIKEYD